MAVKHQEDPCRRGDAVPPCGLGVSLRVQDVVHARHGERHYGRGLGQGGSLYGDPHLVLQPGGVGIDLLEFTLIAGAVEGNPQVGVSEQHGLDPRRVGRREQPGADIFGADGIGFGFLVGLAQVVARGGHGEGKADDQGEQREGGSLHDAEIVALAVLQRPLAANHRAISSPRAKARAPWE